HYYLALSSKCNLLCKYCYGKTNEDFLSENELENYDLDLPEEINFNIDDLLNFSKLDNDLELTFYGGEPLLKIDLIKEIMDKIPVKKFLLQTNGIFLDKLDSSYVNKLDTILVSIDGTLSHTNERRGNGVFEKIINNLNLIRKNGFKGEIIARMTVDETCNIYENVRFLLDNPLFKFNSVHWQLDAQFWRSDYLERDFKNWVLTEYNPNLLKLINWWLDEIKKKQIVHKIYPFLGILNSIITKEKSLLKCGSGHSVLGIQTNGMIAACPITAGYKPFYMANIKDFSLETLKKNLIFPDNSCLNCEIADICGGRCLYANKTKLWGEKGFDEVCDTVFFIVNALKIAYLIIEKQVKLGLISWEMFDYNKYNGVEIIP
ncbi:TIGR04084 family radical SAM/SPASM domain-containing protein, partial [bacterium]|nr:TIGR04084 family radical SAM/SPASM domain-containing protein [bacterium]